MGNESDKRVWAVLRRGDPLLMVLAALLMCMAFGPQRGAAQSPEWTRPGETPSTPAASSEPLLRSADQLASAGEREGALALLRQLEERATTPGVTGRMAALEAALARHREAEGHAQAALRAPDDPWVQAHLSELARVLSESARHLGTVVVDGLPPGTMASVDGEQVAVLPSLLRLMAGAAAVTLTQPDGRTGTLRVTVIAQQTTRVDGTRIVGPPVPASTQHPPVASSPVAPSPRAPTSAANPARGGGPPVTSESQRAWQDFVRGRAPQEARTRRVRAWLEGAPAWRIWAGLRIGMVDRGSMFHQSGSSNRCYPYYAYSPSISHACGPVNSNYGHDIEPAYGLHVGAEFELVDSLLLDGTIRFQSLGGYADFRNRDLPADPAYTSKQVKRSGHLYLVSVGAVLRWAPNRRRARPSFYAEGGAELAMLMYPHTSRAVWLSPVAADDGPKVSGFSAGFAAFGLVQLGMYLNAQKTLDLGVEFRANQHSWATTASFSVALTGWMSSSADGETEAEGEGR